MAQLNQIQTELDLHHIQTEPAHNQIQTEPIFLFWSLLKSKPDSSQIHAAKIHGYSQNFFELKFSKIELIIRRVHI